MRKIAVLDDVLKVSPRMADWSRINREFSVEIFDRNLSVPEEAANKLAGYEVVCFLRERMAAPRSLFERLPNLTLAVATGPYHRTLDLQAATEFGVVVSCGRPFEALGDDPKTPTNAAGELAWAHILALSKQLSLEDRRMRQGGWHSTLGTSLEGKTLGLLGLGRLGRRMIGIASAFGMSVIAWSQNLKPEDAERAGAAYVSKDELFARSDFISIHVVLSERTRHLVGEHELSLMKPSAYLVNTARGPIVDEQALLAALQQGNIAGAGLDVFAVEPLPLDHPLRSLDNVVLTPHIGFSTEEVYRHFYEDTVEAIEAYMAGEPIRLLNPEVMNSPALRMRRNAQ